MSAAALPALQTLSDQILEGLRDRNVPIRMVGSVWRLNDTLNFWPQTLHYKVSPACGELSGEFRPTMRVDVMVEILAKFSGCDPGHPPGIQQATGTYRFCVSCGCKFEISRVQKAKPPKRWVCSDRKCEELERQRRR